MNSLDEAKAVLYGNSIESFVAERDALVKKLRSAGNRDLANEIKSLRKPSAVAAEVNRVVRADPAGVELILQAAALLRDAQQGALEGSSVDASELQQQYRAAIQALAQSAEAKRAEVRSALEAATIDEASNDALRMGALVVVPTPESIFGTAPATARPAADATQPSTAKPTKRPKSGSATAPANNAQPADKAQPAKQPEDELAKRRAKRDEAAAAKHAAEQAKEQAKEQARKRKQREKERRERRKQLAKEHREAVRAHLDELEAEEAASAHYDETEGRIVEIDNEIRTLEASLQALHDERPQAVRLRDAAEESLQTQRQRSTNAEAAVTALAELLDQLELEVQEALDNE